MARKKKFDGYIGFLWNVAGISWVQDLARARELNPSDICRQAMQLFRDVVDGKAIVTYVQSPAIANTLKSDTGDLSGK